MFQLIQDFLLVKKLNCSASRIDYRWNGILPREEKLEVFFIKQILLCQFVS